MSNRHLPKKRGGGGGGQPHSDAVALLVIQIVTIIFGAKRADIDTALGVVGRLVDELDLSSDGKPQQRGQA